MSAPIIAAWYDYTGSVLRNSVMTRPFTLPSDWQKIRVGLLASWTTGSAGNLSSYPVFSFGVCSGTTASYGDATTDHYLGFLMSSSTWTYSATDGGPLRPSYSLGGDFFAVRKDLNGTVKSADLAPSVTCYNMCFNVSASVSVGRQPFCFDITKGSPNYTCRATYEISAVAGTMNINYFLWQMMTLDPDWDNAIANTQNGSAVTIPVNESLSGSFNAVSITWNREFPDPEPIVYAIVVVRLI